MATITDNDLKMFQERAKTEFASRCDTGGIAWDSVIWDLCNEVRRLRSVSKERGDCAKLREALDESRRIASDLGGCRLNDYWKLNEIVRVCEAALAAPARNCDVGTAKEQVKRWRRFCNSMTTCGECPCHKSYSEVVTDCFSRWAQMPYEEGGIK